MRIKKILALILMLALLTTSVCACSKDTSSSSDDGSSAADETSVTEESTVAPTQPASDPPKPSNEISPLLWKVSGKGGGSVYLYGTMHLGDKRSDIMLDKLKPYLSQCSALGLEIDNQALEEDYELMMEIYRACMYDDGSKTKDHMRSDLYDKSVDYLKEAGYYYEYLDLFKSGFWTDMLELAGMEKMKSLSMDKAMEEELTGYANDNDIPIVSIENIVDHATISSDLSDDLNDLLIEDFFDNLDTYEDSAKDFYETWLTGDRDRIKELLEEEDEEELASMTDEEKKLYEEYEKALLTDRNVIMADKVEAFLKGDKNTFFAVGSAHYFGDDGIISLLTKRGYRIEWVPDSASESLPLAA